MPRTRRQEAYIKRLRIIKNKGRKVEISKRFLSLLNDDVRIVPMIAGFKRIPGSFNNIWRWDDLSDVKIK